MKYGRKSLCPSINNPSILSHSALRILHLLLHLQFSIEFVTVYGLLIFFSDFHDQSDKSEINTEIQIKQILIYNPKPLRDGVRMMLFHIQTKS